ncbi:hypothetical protein DFP72DRAFT_606664 [Ephemerocybe angulata]|uniref:Uncharacterized protein n=1 Tax=Ephemerocybe angulata TaxID=980116 RepID=A0A8H6HHY9_9AGAR|nr:hypothetical protein DFP72DRAFT_606664 [Tulosesus angulatus]
MADLGAHMYTRSPHARHPHILVTLLYAFLLSRIPGLHLTPLPRAIRQIASECISTTGLLVKLPYDTVTFPSPALDHRNRNEAGLGRSDTTRRISAKCIAVRHPVAPTAPQRACIAGLSIYRPLDVHVVRR